MSTGVTVYSVPIDRLRKVPGSKDRGLLAASVDLAGFFESVDEIAVDLDDDEGRPPSCAEALRQIVDGESLDPRFGYVYGYAYQALCALLGSEAGPSWSSIAGSGRWFDEIELALSARGVPPTLTDLLYRGPLIEIPEPDDFPGLGWWTADEVGQASHAFAKHGPPRPGAGATDMDDTLDDIRAWADFAAARPWAWLVGVHS